MERGEGCARIGAGCRGWTGAVAVLGRPGSRHARLGEWATVAIGGLACA